MTKKRAAVKELKLRTKFKSKTKTTRLGIQRVTALKKKAMLLKKHRLTNLNLNSSRITKTKVKKTPRWFMSSRSTRKEMSNQVNKSSQMKNRPK